MVKINCLICNKIFEVKPYRKKTAKFCSYKCVGLFRKGKPSWCKGLKLPYIPHLRHRGHIPYNKQLKQKKNCVWCRKIMLVTQWGMKNKKYCSNKCKEKAHSNNLRGNKSHFWKGGLTPLSKRIRNSGKFRKWRLMVFGRDNFTCRKCGKRGVYFEAHHIKSFSKYPKLRFKVSNGITLCKKCHIKTDNYSWKAKAAFEKIASLKQGIIEVKVEVLK